MKLKWRRKEFSFSPRILKGARDSFEKGSRINVTAPIFAFDTESVGMEDRYEPICFQVADPGGNMFMEWIPPRGDALRLFLDWWIRRYSWEAYTHKHVFMYAHNLVYDWGQLIKTRPDLIAIARTGIGLPEDLDLWETEDYRVTLRKDGLFCGSAPHFTISVAQSHRERVEIHFRDTFSFFPASLDRITKDLGLTPKLPRPEGIGRVDYRTLEAGDPELESFIAYALVDPEATRQTAERIRQLHEGAGMARIRVSSPGYAINKLLHVIEEGTEILTGDNDPETMQLILETYAGGRTGGVYHGEVEGVSVLDFHSSYPASMTALPSFSPEMAYFKHPAPEELDPDELREILRDVPAFLRIDGEETDHKYPALITSHDGKLFPVAGAFTGLATTGVEVYGGLMSGSLRVDRVTDLILLLEATPDPYLPFREFVLSAYGRKESAPKDSPDYVSAKLELNSSYGKLIESRDETPVPDEVGYIILPYLAGDETEFGKIYYQEWIESLSPESSRTFLQRLEPLIESITDELGEDLKTATFRTLSLTKLQYGRYAIPAAASLITAISRARLRLAMVCLDALYWDTDSVFINEPDPCPEKINAALSKAREWLPRYTPPVSFGDHLGELGIEIVNASGYLAGTKRYYLTGEDGSIKKALHGIPSAPHDEAENMLHALATGHGYEYTGRARPLTVNEAKGPEQIGRFDSRDYAAQFHLDDRLEWEQIPGGWIGKVIPIQN